MAVAKCINEGQLQVQPSESEHDHDEDFPAQLLHHSDVDRGWAWMALVSSFFVMVLIGLCMPLTGFMYVYHLEIFGKSPALTACIGSLMTALMHMCGPVSGWVSTRYSRRLCVTAGGLIVCISLAASSQTYNFWLLLVTNGLIAGFGLGLVTTAAHINIGCYFVKKRTLASGICVMGFPLGVFLSPPIVQYLESVFGWRGAMLIFAGLQLNHCLLGVIMVPSPLEKYHELQNLSENENQDLKQTQTAFELKSPRRSVYKIIPFYFLSLAFLFSNFTINVLYVHLPSFMYKRGGTAGDIRMLYLMLGSAGVISKLLTGLGTGNVKNGKNIDKLSLLLGSLSIVGTVILVFSSLVHVQWCRLLLMFVVGFYYNVEPVMYVPISIETVGFANLPDAIGLIHLFEGFGVFVGPPLAAFVASATGDYDNAFYMAGAVNFLAVISLTVMLLVRPTVETKTASTSNSRTSVNAICETRIENETTN